MTREEAIKVVKSATVYTPKEIEALETLIPGFTQSEDDRILNALITHIRIYEGDFTTVGITRSEILNYLEKLKEQKPTEYNEYKMLIEGARENGKIEGRKEVIEHPDKYGLTKQKSLKWSEEDERELQKCIKIVERLEDDHDIAYSPYSNLLKSFHSKHKK